MINAAVRNSIRGSGRQAYPHQVARALPRAGLLLYLGRPNLEAADVPIGDDTEIGDDTIIRWMFLLPADADIRAATGWVSGVGNIFYDAVGDPVAVLASEIAAWSSVNQWNVLFHLVSAETETGRLAIYAVDTPVEILDRAMKVLRAPQPDLPSAFFNGDFRLATYTGGHTYVPDHLGVLRSPGGNKPACQGFRLDGVTYLNTDESGNAILPSTPQKTVTYNTDWTAKTFAETFDKFDISDPLKAPGWLCEPVRTNKCTCRKANPVDTTNLVKSGDVASVLSVVGNTTALAAAGLTEICTLGNVYKFDTTGATVDSYVKCSGLAGNTNKHSYSGYFIKSGGDAFLTDISSASMDTPIPSSSIFTYVKRENRTGTVTADWTIRVKPNTIIYFILPQLEEGPFCTSPIVSPSDPLTSLTRAATVASFPTAGKIPVNNFAIRMIVVPRAAALEGIPVFSTYLDANNLNEIQLYAGSIRWRKRVAGVNTDTLVHYNYLINTPIDIVVTQSSDYGTTVSARPLPTGTWANGMPVTTLAAKANVNLSENYQLGAKNNASQFTGNISLFDCVPIPTGITDPMAWAKTHWGVA